MASYFLDSSALVKVYVSELGSAWVRAVLDSEGLGDAHIAAITPVEVVAALTRRSRGTGGDAAEAARGVQLFRRALTDGAYDVVELPLDVFDHATDLAETHGLGGYDAVQLAAALAVGRLVEEGEGTCTLVSSDAELNAAAAAEGLEVQDPTAHGR